MNTKVCVFPHSDNYNLIIRIINIEGDHIALTRSQGPSSGGCAVLCWCRMGDNLCGDHPTVIKNIQ